MRHRALFFLLLCAPVVAFAKPTKDELRRAKELYEQGEARYNLGQFQEALQAFEESYILSKRPELLLNLAQCYRYLRRNEEAIALYKSFLREFPASPDRAEIESVIVMLSAPASAPSEESPKITNPEQAPLELRYEVNRSESAPLTLARFEPVPLAEPRSGFWQVSLGLGAAASMSGLFSLQQSLSSQEKALASAPDTTQISELRGRARAASLVADGLWLGAAATTGAMFLLRPHSEDARLMKRASLVGGVAGGALLGASLLLAREASLDAKEPGADGAAISSQRDSAKALARGADVVFAVSLLSGSFSLFLSRSTNEAHKK